MTVTDDLRARLKEDQRIIEEATDGPWEVLKERVVTEDMDLVTPRLHSEPEAAFIAASRTRWEQANQALLKVLELHKQVVQGVYSDGSVAYECDHCPDEWPCPTVRTLTDNLTGEDDEQ